MNIIRNLTFKIQKYLEQDEIILIIGARQAGKTTVLHQLESFLKKQDCISYFLDLDDPDYVSLLNQSPKNLFKIFPIQLEQKIFLFIDEIQYLADPTQFLKYFFDTYRGKIKIIASGSSAFYVDKKFKDSLVGRKKIFYLYTLSFREFLRFKNETVLAEKDFSQITLSEREKNIIYYQEYLTFGGYPRVVLSPVEEKIEVLRDIAYSYIKKDLYDAHLRQEEFFYKLFKILASQVGNLVNSSELSSTLGISRTAIDNYLYVMQKSFHITLVRTFFKNIRKELTKMPKVYFMDIGLRNFFKGNFDLYQKRDDKGQLLENACYRHLLEKYEIEEIKFWRTIQKEEVDFITGENKAYEVKAKINEAKVKEYQKFLETYPNIELSFVSFDFSPQIHQIASFPLVEVWLL